MTINEKGIYLRQRWIKFPSGVDGLYSGGWMSAGYQAGWQSIYLYRVQAPAEKLLKR